MSELGVATNQVTSEGNPPLAVRSLEQIDRWCEWFGDVVNPIMVKEARQALKSRQFVFTFSGLLFAALGWTIVGSLSMMPQIYTSPSAPRMLIGYYFVLAVPMLLVVPMAAYRSLEAEIDDGTLELLSISALGPWQIVLGKLASAMLQMGLYFVALVPCVAYAYNLRGVDLPTTLLILGVLLVAAIMLTIAALFMAAISSSRTGRITSLFVVVASLLVAQWGLGELVVALVTSGNPLAAGGLFFAVIATAALSLSVGNLLLTVTAAQLTPESENRSTRIRIAMLLISAVVIGLNTLALQTLNRDAIGWICLAFFALGLLWTIAGSMMAAESPVQTPRIRRELPRSFLARCTLTWLTPGPATGLVFAVVNVVVLTAIISITARVLQSGPAGVSTLVSTAERLAVAYAVYLIGFLVLVRLIVAWIRVHSHPRAEIGLVTLIATAVLFALVPYSIGLHLNDYREFPYSFAQITNWAWTFSEINEGVTHDLVVITVAVVSGCGFVACLLASSDLVLPRRIATPERVLQEMGR